MEPPSKKPRLGESDNGLQDTNTLPLSLSHPVSPPRTKRSRLSPTSPAAPTAQSSSYTTTQPAANNFKSPFQLTWIRDLPDAANTDAVKLADILGDPLIAECWNFNYLHDVDFLKAAFDEDIRDTVRIHLVHGFWKKEDPSRLMLQEAAKANKNVKLHNAFLPEMFGTHHSKMLILFRHDDTAQIVIHTANMIARDWTNMTQAVWRSPLLPLESSSQATTGGKQVPTIGNGAKFKIDLLNYLRAYNRKWDVCDALVTKLQQHNFSAIQAALIASVPGRQNTYDQTEETKWGHAALKDALRTVPVQDGPSEIVVQVSSIATLGAKDTWLRNGLFDALKASKNETKTVPKFKVVFPTADEIRRSLDGYESGQSIHTKIQSKQQAAQLLYLRPMYCHWANDAERGGALKPGAREEGGRKRAAPHIKTYIRYGEKSIDWALTTSANLSKQAWGEGVGELRIASYEIGVLVWPALFAEDAKMLGTFRKDTPDKVDGDEAPVVGLRIPYNLPLQPYGANEKPWVATMSHHQPDWNGETWVVPDG